MVDLTTLWKVKIDFPVYLEELRMYINVTDSS